MLKGFLGQVDSRNCLRFQPDYGFQDSGHSAVFDGNRIRTNPQHCVEETSFSTSVLQRARPPDEQTGVARSSNASKERRKDLLRH